MPKATRFPRARMLVVPLAVLILIVALFAGYRQTLIRREQDAIRTEAMVSAEQVASRLEDAIATRLELANHLRDHGVRDSEWSETGFREIASGILQGFPGIVAINWVDADGIIRWVVPEEPNRAAKGRDLTRNAIAAPALEAARTGHRVVVTPPLELYQGGLGFAAYAAVERGDRVIGFVNVAIRTGPLIDICLARGVRETHELVIVDGECELFRSAPDDEGRMVYRVDRDLSVGDRTWRLELWPRASVVETATGSGHELLLVLGLLFGSGLAFSLYRLTRSRVRLATSEERYRTIVEDSPAFVCRFRPDATITFVNAAFAAALGLDPSALVGTSVLDHVPVADRDRVRKQIARLAVEGPLRRNERRMVRSDGSAVWVGWAERALLDRTGAVLEIQAIGLDATENVRAREALRRSEVRFRTIVNSVNEGILVLDVGGNIEDANDRACEMFERDHAAMVGASIAALDLSGAPGILSVLGRVRADGDAVHPFAWDVRGSVRQWHAEVELRGAEVDDQFRVIAVVRDVTARVRLEEQLQQSQKMEAMGTLATGVAHDFNNILTAIVGYAERVRAEVPPDSPAATSIGGVLTACDQAAGVTRSLLTFGRGTPAHPVPTDLTAVARATIDLLRPLLPDAIEVACEVPIDQPLWVRGDASQLQQVLLNLALNGRDAMPDGGRLTVALHEDRDEADDPTARRVVLQVTDSGSGMSEEVRNRVLEPFFTTKPRERGTGLGMSVVHGIVSAHAGELRIDSRPGHGTCVTVRFPSCAPQEAPGQDRRSRARRPIDDARILLVEDNDQVRALLDRALTDRGLTVTPARDGIEALERYRNAGAKFDLFVFDVDLPRMSGTACLAEIRKHGGRQPAILISGNPDIGVAMDGPYVVRFLAKPFRMDAVAALIEELL